MESLELCLCTDSGGVIIFKLNNKADLRGNAGLLYIIYPKILSFIPVFVFVGFLCYNRGTEMKGRIIMRKVSYFDFLKRFLVINLILIGGYFVVTLILNMFFGEAMKILQTTPVYSGEGNTFLLVFIILFQLCIGAGYFVLSYLDARRDAIERREFLTFIGTEKFDTDVFYKTYFANKGKSLMIYFSVTVFAIALLSFPCGSSRSVRVSPLP